MGVNIGEILEHLEKLGVALRALAADLRAHGSSDSARAAIVESLREALEDASRRPEGFAPAALLDSLATMVEELSTCRSPAAVISFAVRNKDEAWAAVLPFVELSEEWREKISRRT